MNKFNKKIIFIFLGLIFFGHLKSAYAGFGNDHAAILREYKNKVKVKPSGNIAWEDVVINMKLYEGDRVRTMEESQAIAFYSNTSNLVINENSLVVIKNMIQKENLKRADIELSHGSVKGKVEANPEEDVVMIISSTPFEEEASIEIDSRKTNDKKMDVDIELDDNKDISVYVNEGKAKVTSKGKSVELGKNQSTVIEPNAAPKNPWFGKKRPFNRVILICSVFLGLIVIIAIGIVIKNRKEIV